MPELLLILVDVQGIYMLIRYIQIFTKKIYPEVPHWVRASKKNFAYFVSDWTGDSRLTHYLTSTSQKLYVSTNTICEHNIPDILFLRSFNLNSMCSARGNVSYLFFSLRDKHTTFYGRLHVLYVSII
jgi:hypothetical protein